DGEEMVTMTVPVSVPFGRFEGSALTSSVTPSAGRTPLAGTTVSHGLSTVAVNGCTRPSLRPGTKTCCTTISVLPTGTVTLGFFCVFGGGGSTTTRICVEYGPKAWPQSDFARTR